MRPGNAHSGKTTWIHELEGDEENREREREREAFLCSSVSFLLSFAEQGRSIEGGGPLAAAAADRGVNGEYPMS